MTDINIVLPGDGMLNKGYEDLLHPSFKLVGETLREIISIPSSILLIGTKYMKREVIKKLDERINGISEENRIPIVPELGIPLLRDLSYYSNSILADMFMELLVKSADRDTVNDVLPSYIKIIENLSTDEALILEHLYQISKGWNKINLFNIPCISLRKKFKNGENAGGFITYYNNLSELYFVEGFNSVENMDVYIENLISLGIINIPSGISISDENVYKKLESYLREKVPQYFNHIESEISDSEELEINKELIELTRLGSNFLSAIHPKD